MLVNFLKSKIHRATITDANLYYNGSLTVDEDLLEEANLREFEQVTVVNINTGSRFETYLIKGERGKGDICLNGAAARLGAKGDLVIIMAYCLLDSKEAETYEPKIVFVDEKNKVSKQ
jgi:aspartate 1-decarboxylase